MELLRFDTFRLNLFLQLFVMKNFSVCWHHPSSYQSFLSTLNFALIFNSFK